MLNTAGGGEDTSPDWVWQSAGRVTATGYAVEIRLPLQSIRLKGGADVQMGVLFWRRISRVGVSVSWPALEPGKWVFQKHAKLAFTDLSPADSEGDSVRDVLARTGTLPARASGRCRQPGGSGGSVKWGWPPRSPSTRP